MGALVQGRGLVARQGFNSGGGLPLRISMVGDNESINKAQMMVGKDLWEVNDSQLPGVLRSLVACSLGPTQLRLLCGHHSATRGTDG